MSMPLDQQPPPVTVTQHPYNYHAGHASIGPVIAVLLVIVVLGIVAGMIGRLCTGRKIMCYGQYDIESWIETKCSSCIDGRIYPPQPTYNASATSVPPSIQHQPQQTTTAP
ncbi:Telomere maintenance component 1, putative isoform 1 [Hibiscus syriacus]|uniref:Telomere maintenance component 1, putative isoform 1 n=1 Tax=Hibiscus syriacus TaxID=106335 RepID=A0A6A2XGE6_HIBSY|nr:Telomere maintenance component 1, putative isoform 1 [Hibiscus syriacus]